jgi:hypothetical protein
VLKLFAIKGNKIDPRHDSQNVEYVAHDAVHWHNDAKPMASIVADIADC